MLTELPDSYVSYEITPTFFIPDYVDGILDNDKDLALDFLKNNLLDADCLSYYPVDAAVEKWPIMLLI